MKAKRLQLLTAATVIVMVLSVHWRSVHSGCQNDDDVYWRAVTPSLAWDRIVHRSSRPQNISIMRPTLQLFALALNSVSLSPVFQHTVNIGLHLTVCGLLYVLCGHISSRPLFAPATTILFSISAGSAECVSWLSGNSALLLTLLVIATILFQLRSHFVLALVAYTLALGCHEAAVMILPCIVALSLILRVRLRAWHVASYAALLGLYWVAHAGDQRYWTEIYGLQNVPGSLVAYPAIICGAYPWIAWNSNGTTIYVAWVVGILLALAAVFTRPHRDGFLGMAWYALFITPYLPFSWQWRAERYTYLAAIGACILAASLVSRMKPAGAAVLFALAVSYMWIHCDIRAQVWRHQYELWAVENSTPTCGGGGEPGGDMEEGT